MPKLKSFPVQSPWVATLNAPAAVPASGQLPFGVPPFVIEPLVGTATVVAGSRVLLAPSTRSDTFAPAPSAGAARTAATATGTPAAARIPIRFMRGATLSTRASAWWSEAGLLALGPTNRAFPAACAASGIVAVGVPDDSGGSAPDSHRLPIATDPERGWIVAERLRRLVST